MTLSLAPRQADLFSSTVAFCDQRVAPDSIYGILHRECFGLFPDEMFADLFDEVGRRSVPPMIVAVVMVLQRIEGLSDREAADRFGRRCAGPGTWALRYRWRGRAGRGATRHTPSFPIWVLIEASLCGRCPLVWSRGAAMLAKFPAASKRIASRHWAVYAVCAFALIGALTLGAPGELLGHHRCKRPRGPSRMLATLRPCAVSHRHEPGTHSVGTNVNVKAKDS